MNRRAALTRLRAPLSNGRGAGGEGSRAGHADGSVATPSSDGLRPPPSPKGRRESPRSSPGGRRGPCAPLSNGRGVEGEGSRARRAIGLDAAPSSGRLCRPPSLGGRRTRGHPLPEGRGSRERARDRTHSTADPRADPALRLSRSARRSCGLAHLSSLHRAWRGGDRRRGKPRPRAQRRHGARRTGDPRRRRLVRAHPSPPFSRRAALSRSAWFAVDDRDFARHGESGERRRGA